MKNGGQKLLWRGDGTVGHSWDDVWPDREELDLHGSTGRSQGEAVEQTGAGWCRVLVCGEKCEFHSEYSGNPQQSIRGGLVGNI